LSISDWVPTSSTRLRKMNSVVYTAQTVAIAGNDCQQTYVYRRSHKETVVIHKSKRTIKQ